MSTLKRTLEYAGMSALGMSAKVSGSGALNKALKRRMANKMVNMKGVPMKVSQILGMGQKENAEIFKQAQLEIDPIPINQVKEIIEQAAPGLLHDFELLEDCCCASLGQVNHLKAANKEYAVKIQYPESADNLNMDEKALKFVSGTFNGFSKGFNMGDYQKMLKEELALELDYSREIAMQDEFHQIFSSEVDMVIPLSYKEYSAEGCLVMSWEPSINLDNFLRVANEEMKKKATRLISQFYMTSMFQHGILHADPNPGNFGFRVFDKHVQLVVYDFGSVVKLKHQQHMDILALFSMTLNNQNPLGALLAVGFDVDMLTPMKDRLSAMMMVLFEPFLSEQIFVFDKWQRKEKIRDILGEDRWNFMVAAPAELFLFMRCIYGLFYYPGKLTGTIYCRPSLEKALAIHSRDIKSTINDFQVEQPLQKELSEYMIISVKESGVRKVKLKMPVRSIDNLETIIPPDICEKLIANGIKTEDLVKKVRQNAYRPQEVFNLIDGSKEISVFLG